MNKICIGCGEEKSEEDFYFANSRKTTRYSICKKCHNQKRKKSGYSGGISASEYQRIKHQEYRNKIINFLGNKCARCGYDENPLAFDIDHINNDGSLSRITASGKTKKGSNFTDLKRILENDCAGVQILCGTCHHIKTRIYNIETGLYKF